VTIFDVTGKEIKTFNLESDELGVQLQNSTDLISKQINENIEEFNNINQERSHQSPFILLYTPFSIITMGIDTGYLFIFGNWSSIYNNKLYYSPFIDFDLTDDLLLSMKITSIQTDSDVKDVSSYSQIRILSGTLAVSYIYQLSSSFGIAVSAGGGMTRSKITIGPDQPFTPPLSEKESIDPNIDISSYLIYNFSTVTLRTGFLYKRIFYKNEPMDSGVIFAGAGIHF
jgi:hypothetical protein